MNQAQKQSKPAFDWDLRELGPRPKALSGSTTPPQPAAAPAIKRPRPAPRREKEVA
jgi:hypothetical protein